MLKLYYSLKNTIHTCSESFGGRPSRTCEILETIKPTFHVVVLVCMYGHTCSKSMINRVRLPILLVVNWAGKINISLSALVLENLVSRDGLGSPVPRQPAHLHTQAESGAYLLRDWVPRRRPFIHLTSGQSRVYRVTQLRTDGVHCRESAGTGPVNLKTVPNECCLGGHLLDQLIHGSLSHTHLYVLFWFVV